MTSRLALLSDGERHLGGQLGPHLFWLIFAQCSTIPLIPMERKGVVPISFQHFQQIVRLFLSYAAGNAGKVTAVIGTWMARVT